MKILRVLAITLFIILAISGLEASDCQQTGNLGYNSYEGFISNGRGLNRYFGPGVGYDTGPNTYFPRYFTPQEWGRFGYGTGHLGMGWGPYVFGNQNGQSQPGMFDPPMEAYKAAPPPVIRLRRGEVRVGLPDRLPGVKCITVTLLAYNGAELSTQVLTCPPFKFCFPVMDECTSVRVRIDYNDNGFSSTAYPL